MPASCTLHYQVQGMKFILADAECEAWYGKYPLLRRYDDAFRSAVREMREETGLTILDPKLCCVKQFQNGEGERYLVFLFAAYAYEGTLRDSTEGHNDWYERDQLQGLKLVDDLEDQLHAMESPEINEFLRIEEDDLWYSEYR